MEHYKLQSEMSEAIRFANENSSDELFLSQLDLANLDDQIGKLKEVTSIYLFGNNFDAFPMQLCQMPQLERIYISGNNIKSIPNEIGNLKELKLLDIKNNQLTELPLAFGKLTKLETLYIGDNEFENFPKSLLHCAQLKKLDLKGNLIHRVPDEIGRLSHLKQLDLSKNQLTILPNGIGNLLALKKLHASNNMITAISPSLANLVNLKSNNQKYDWERGLSLDENPILKDEKDTNLEPNALIAILTRNSAFTVVPEEETISIIEKIPEEVIKAIPEPIIEDISIEEAVEKEEEKLNPIPVIEEKKDAVKQVTHWKINQPMQRREELIRFNIFGSNEIIAEELMQEAFHIDNEHGNLRFKINGQFVEFGVNRFADIPFEDIGNKFFKIPNGINFIVVSKFKELKQLNKICSVKRTIGLVAGKVPKKNLYDFPVLSFNDPVRFEIELANHLAHHLVKLKNKLLREDLRVLNELLTSSQKFSINKEDFDQYAEPAGISSKLEHGFAKKFLSKRGYIYHEPHRLYLSKKIVLNKSKLFHALYLLNNSVYLAKQQGVIEEKYFDKIFGNQFDEEIHLFLFEVMLHEGWCKRISKDKLMFKWFINSNTIHPLSEEEESILEPYIRSTPNQEPLEEESTPLNNSHIEVENTFTTPDDGLWENAKWFLFWSLLLILFTFSGFLIAILTTAY